MEKGYKTIEECAHNEVDEDALIYKSDRRILINNDYEDGESTYPAYVCLNCGLEFGNFKYRK